MENIFELRSENVLNLLLVSFAFHCLCPRRPRQTNLCRRPQEDRHLGMSFQFIVRLLD